MAELIRDNEQAIRLIHPDHLEDGLITSAAFKTGRPRISFYIKYRSPLKDAMQLHVERFKDYGSWRIATGEIRSLNPPDGLDLQITHVAKHPHEAFGDAHAELVGPTSKRARRRIPEELAVAYNEHGVMEKSPDIMADR